MASPSVRVEAVVLDTNIYISALALPGSFAEEALQKAALRQYDLLLSPAILAELANVLTRKFGWDAARALNACREMSDIADVVKPSERLKVLSDDPDNRILECAMAGHADLIVTGDKHLLNLKRYEGISIVRLADFLKQLA